MQKKIQFSRDTKNFSLTAEITAEGNLVIEFYNHSDAIYEALGSDYSYETHIDHRDKLAVAKAIGNEVGLRQDIDTVILEYFASHFTHHQDIRKWLFKNHIPFRKFCAIGNYNAAPDVISLADATALAQEAHEGQTDKAGAPYFGHLERVMKRVETPEQQIVAILHDSIEDTFVTAEYLRRCGYPEPIIAAIEGLTKRPDEENSDEGYLRFVRRAGQNPLSRAVKIADLQDNMDISRLTEITPADKRRRAKYARALALLEALG